MAEHFDVVIVGARCAGSPLATLLARKGVRVALVERATFPRDTLSSHIMEADALAFLDRLGITDRLRATGAPFVTHADGRFEDVRIRMEWPQQPGDIGGVISVRRFVLDPILAQAAEEAGADVRMGTAVKGLVEDGGRVVGVRVAGKDGEAELRAPLVVGADGRNSTVADLAGARRYNLTANGRGLYWAYFEGAAPEAEPTFVFHRWRHRFVLGIPTDGGLYQVIVWPELSELDRFRADLDAGLMDQLRPCEPLAAAVAGARRVGKVLGAVRWTGFFREASGPGWVLTGDAGHFKDPGPGRGIGDAFLQADALAPAIVAGMDGSGDGLDQAMARWGRWRDDEFAEHYWFATDLGMGGTVPAVFPQIIEGLQRRGKAGDFLDLINHRGLPSKLLTPPRVLGATARTLARRGTPRRAVLREVGELLAEDIRRRRLNRRPDYAAPDAIADAGPTEVGEHATV